MVRKKKGYGKTQIYIDLKKGGVFKQNFLVHRLSFFAKTQSKGFEKEKNGRFTPVWCETLLQPRSSGV